MNKEEKEERLQRAIEEFGETIVQEVKDIVSMSDPDGAWSLFSDLEKYDHVECIEMLYFE